MNEANPPLPQDVAAPQVPSQAPPQIPPGAEPVAPQQVPPEDPQSAQVLLPPGWTFLRFPDRVARIHDDQWPHWVRSGFIPVETMVISHLWTKGVWRPAGALEVYHLYRPSPELEPDRTGDDAPRHGPFGLFRGPGISATESLLLVNVLISAGLLAVWRGAYSENLWGFSAQLREYLLDGWAPVLFIPLFLHASLDHLFSNMISLTGGGAVIEEYFGRKRMLLIYVVSGLFGAMFSLLKGRSVLAVGASGAIMGMFGAALVFLYQNRGRFRFRERWRATRIQLPFLLLMVIPSIFYADLLSHLGGFLAGAILAAKIKPLPDRLPPAQS